ncbi:MAG TPA: hypothetical protein VMF08_10385 [Candidatus Sulfotelmatobacter sp.]|nr:hypothetical protein [Candidatus Sulfotelmatobacter sp.]
MTDTERIEKLERLVNSIKMALDEYGRDYRKAKERINALEDDFKKLKRDVKTLNQPKTQESES